MQGLGSPLIGSSLHISIPISSQDLNFHHNMSWSFLLLCFVSSVKMRGDCFVLLILVELMTITV